MANCFESQRIRACAQELLVDTDKILFFSYEKKKTYVHTVKSSNEHIKVTCEEFQDSAGQYFFKSDCIVMKNGPAVLLFNPDDVSKVYQPLHTELTFCYDTLFEMLQDELEVRFRKAIIYFSKDRKGNHCNSSLENDIITAYWYKHSFAHMCFVLYYHTIPFPKRYQIIPMPVFILNSMTAEQIAYFDLIRRRDFIYLAPIPMKSCDNISLKEAIIAVKRYCMKMLAKVKPEKKSAILMLYEYLVNCLEMRGKDAMIRDK